MGTLKNPPVVTETEVDRPSSSDAAVDAAVTAPELFQVSLEGNVCSRPRDQIACQVTETQSCQADIPEFDNLGPKLSIDYSGEQSQNIKSLDELARVSKPKTSGKFCTEAA